MDVHRKKISQGFTLVELMVTVAILAILSSIAYPGFQNSILNSRMTSQSNTFLAAFQFARSEAASRNLSTMVCGSNDQQTCNQPDWSTGFIIRDTVVTTNSSGDDEINVLQVFEGLNGSAISGGGSIIFDENGMLNNSGGSDLSLCDERGQPEARRFLFNRSGQVQLLEATACPS
ncbi:type IV fimbrial biogenesis protein FimT [Endozoicomonas sp. OPT23]|uniref:GspH/FimT family pseudopilin n=1 Tax=Endozoicomonas sp. OPT23 TaxID=2072845 RepID=UPI00129A7FBC|nr:GspH/FimT family pseudopilin [Endozoicomonas sp. OPT23]MRI33720.1 type IV fimbrial biogenesis protein FimT [Endozoicomonas sp. OPT23]